MHYLKVYLNSSCNAHLCLARFISLVGSVLGVMEHIRVIEPNGAALFTFIYWVLVVFDNALSLRTR